MQELLNVVVGNNKESLVFFSTCNQNFSSMLKFNDGEKNPQNQNTQTLT